MIDKQYEDLLFKVLSEGEEKPDRTGTGTYSLFGAQLRYDLQKGFPLITTKKVHFKSVVGELLWFLSGSTDVRVLREKYGTTIWDEWENGAGTIGPMYGAQWRGWEGDYPCVDCTGEEEADTFDQIANVIESIKLDPHSRRHIVSAWNVADLSRMALAPCHVLFQFYVSADGKRLSCHLFQRSADVFLGLPFNIASYALLTHIIADQTGLEVGELLWSGTDVHLYKNHEHQAGEQLSRDVRQFPTIALKAGTPIDLLDVEDVRLYDYNPHPAIKAPVAV